MKTFLGVLSSEDKHIKIQKNRLKSSAQLLVKNATSIFPIVIDLLQNIIFFSVCVNLNPEYFFVTNYFDFLSIFYM